MIDYILNWEKMNVLLRYLLKHFDQGNYMKDVVRKGVVSSGLETETSLKVVLSTRQQVMSAVTGAMVVEMK